MIRIERASDADIPQITRVEIASKLQSFPDLVEDVDIDYPTREYRWKTYFAGQSPVSARPERMVFKAIADDEMIGYIAVHLTTRYDMDAEIQSFYVLKNNQRLGIGLNLFNAALEWLKKLGASSLCVGVSPGNPYQYFYLKHGGDYLNQHWIFWGNIDEV